MAIDHYENFPVASILLPATLQRPIALIYRFAREADDFADEGDATPSERLAQLATFSHEIARIADHKPCETPWFNELAAVIYAHQLPLSCFKDLLSAFRQDVQQSRYNHYDELLDYSRRSADPVGHLLLTLFGQASPQNLIYSSAICTSLQLINFWQDIAVDWQKGRVYLPQEDMRQFGITEQHLARNDTEGRWTEFMLFQLERTRSLLDTGRPLGQILKGRIGLEMRLIIAGGDCILQKISQVDGDVFRHRPTLKSLDWLVMLLRALFPPLFPR